MPVYVSPTADDGADGSAARPFARIETARDAARESSDRRIVVRAGTYHDVSVDLGPSDSGLTIEAAEGERPIILAGRRVDGWRPDGDGLLAAPLNGVSDGTWDFRSLVVNGRYAPRARLPREGVLHHESTFDAHWMSTSAGGWSRKPTPVELTTMVYGEGGLPEGVEPRNAEIRVYHQWDESLVGVSAIDVETRTVTFAQPCGHPPGAFGDHSHSSKSSWFVVFNTREGMHEPGMWYLDRARGLVVYWPRADEAPETLQVVAPVHTSAVRIHGTEGEPVQDVVIRGLEFGATATRLRSAGFGAARLDAAVSLSRARGVSIQDVEIRNAGGIGIGVKHGDSCVRVAVRACRVESCGGPGIILRGAECEVTDTLVRDVGLTYPSSLGVSVSGRSCRIAHNEIAGCPYSALHGGGEDSVYENNVISDFMRELDDGAAIYVFAGKRVVYRGNVARGGGGASGRFSTCYYLDEQSEDCIVEGNIAIGTTWPFHNHMSRRCTIRDNIAVDAGASLITFMKCAEFTFERNVVVAGGEITVKSPADGIRSMSNNILYSEAGRVTCERLGADGYSMESSLPLEPRDGTVLADPGLTVDDNGDGLQCAFGADSDASRLGIAARDFTGAGRRGIGAHKLRDR